MEKISLIVNFDFARTLFPDSIRILNGLTKSLTGKYTINSLSVATRGEKKNVPFA